MANSNYKFRPARRTLPGQPLPTLEQREVDEQAVRLSREQEYTPHLHRYLTDAFSAQSGARGVRLNKLDHNDLASHAYIYEIEGTPIWGHGMDSASGSGRSDYIPVFDNSANAGGGADVFRWSGEADAPAGTSQTCKFTAGRSVGSPRTFDSFGFLNGGDNVTGLGGLSIGYFDESATYNALKLFNRSTNKKRTPIYFNGQYLLGSDLANANAQTFTLYDSTGLGNIWGTDSTGLITHYYKTLCDDTISCPGVGINSERFGAGSVAAGLRGVALGNGASASQTDSVVVGQAASTRGIQSVSVGQGASGGQRGVAVGYAASCGTAGNDSNVCVGQNAQVGDGSASNTLVGQGAQGTGGATIFGSNNKAGGSSLSIGVNLDARGSICTLVGSNNTATTGRTACILIGNRLVANADQQCCIGGLKSQGSQITKYYLGGVTDTSFDPVSLQPVGASGSNIAGCQFSINGGQGTGNAKGGDVLIQTSPAGIAGSGLNPLSTIAQYTGDSKIGWFGVTPVAQQANNVDLGIVVSNFGLRASGGNFPLNMGTGSLTAGASTFTAPALSRCLTLNADTGATVFVQPKTGTLYSNYKVNGAYQWGTDPLQSNTNLWVLQNLGTGNIVLQSDLNDLVTIGSTNASGGAVLGVSGGKAAFYSGTPVVKPTVSGQLGGDSALRSLVTALSGQSLITNSTTSNDPTTPSWAWYNQGGASVTTTNGQIFLSAPANAGDSLRGRVITVPVAPYTITMGYLPQIVNANYINCGLMLYDSVSGKVATFGPASNSSDLATGLVIDCLKWTNGTTFSAEYTTTPSPFWMFPWTAGSCMWLQIHDDNTNRIYNVSNDGVNWVTVFSVGRTDFLTPNNIGFYVDVNNATYPGGITVTSWQQS